MAGRPIGRLLAVFAGLAALVCACSAAETPQLYGSVSSLEELEKQARPLTALSEGDSGSEVVVSGTINRVCQTMGCWLYLAQGESLVYVDLEQGARFTVPVDSAGRRAVISGTYLAEGGDARVVAKSAAVWP